MRGLVQPHVAGGHVDQLLHARAGVVEHAQQHRVSAPGAVAQIGLRQNLGKEFLREVTDELAWVSTQRDG